MSKYRMMGISSINRGQQLMRSMPDDIQEFYNGTDFFVAVDLDGVVWIKWFGDDWAGICEESERDKLIEYFRYMMKSMKEDDN